MSSKSGDYQKVPQPEDGSKNKYIYGCIGFTLVIVVVVFLVIPISVGIAFTAKHRDWAEDIYVNCKGYPDKFCTSGDWLTPKNMTRYVAWNGCDQGYKSDKDLEKCGSPCFSPRLVSNADDFNKNNDFKLVSFPSRKGPDGQKTVTLKAWWLPSGKTGAPTVVIQHGNNANFNSRMVVLSAYLLRSLGIDVLMHSLRDHGMSGKGSGKVTWGWEYAFDLLGAWDYAVKDPDGHLGGSKDPQKVGIMGMSMGGFIVNTAFGMEHGIPGVWSDGAVFSVSGFLANGPLSSAGPLASTLASLGAWWGGVFAGVDIQRYEPSKTLPTGPTTKRKVAVVASALDTFVPTVDSLKTSDLVKTLKDKYDLLESWTPSTDCNGNAHCSIMFAMPEKYREKLYDFWSSVFELEHNASFVSSLPKLSKDAHGDTTDDETQRRLHVVV